MTKETEWPGYDDEGFAAIISHVRACGGTVASAEESDVRWQLNLAAWWCGSLKELRTAKTLAGLKARLRSSRRAVDSLEHAKLRGDRGGMAAEAARIDGRMVRSLRLMVALEEPARDLAAALTALGQNIDAEIQDVDREIERLAGPRIPDDSFLNVWLSDLASLWEQFGLRVNQGPAFASFVQVCATEAVKGKNITEAVAREFVRHRETRDTIAGDRIRLERVAPGKTGALIPFAGHRPNAPTSSGAMETRLEQTAKARRRSN